MSAPVFEQEKYYSLKGEDVPEVLLDRNHGKEELSANKPRGKSEERNSCYETVFKRVFWLQTEHMSCRQLSARKNNSLVILTQVGRQICSFIACGRMLK